MMQVPKGQSHTLDKVWARNADPGGAVSGVLHRDDT